METIGQFELGIVGLGVMGRNLLLNMADHGFAAAGLDLDQEKVSALESEALAEHQVKATTSVNVFLGLLKKPRAILLLVPAGKPVDSAIKDMLPLLEEGDILIDGGKRGIVPSSHSINSPTLMNIRTMAKAN